MDTVTCEHCGKVTPKKAVERLRQRYGELLRQEISHTVSDPGEVDEEIRYLRTVLGAQ